MFFKFSLHWFGFHCTPITRLRSYKAAQLWCLREGFELAVIWMESPDLVGAVKLSGCGLLWGFSQLSPLAARPSSIGLASCQLVPLTDWPRPQLWPPSASLSQPASTRTACSHTLNSCYFNNQPWFCKRPETSLLCIR